MTDMNGRSAPAVRVIRYSASTRAAVQGFADVEIDGKWRVNGLNLMRDGSLKAGQLTPLIHNRRCSVDSIQIIDKDLRESLTAAILAAIRSHLETLPPGERVKPPQPPERRKRDEQPARAAAASTKPQNAPVEAKPASATLPATPIKPKPVQTVSVKPAAGNPSLPPPPRLLANLPRAANPAVRSNAATSRRSFRRPGRAGSIHNLPELEV